MKIGNSGEKKESVIHRKKGKDFFNNRQGTNDRKDERVREEEGQRQRGKE